MHRNRGLRPDDRFAFLDVEALRGLDLAMRISACLPGRRGRVRVTPAGVIGGGDFFAARTRLRDNLKLQQGLRRLITIGPGARMWN
jgi:hypothetical protein